MSKFDYMQELTKILNEKKRDHVEALHEVGKVNKELEVYRPIVEAITPKNPIVEFSGVKDATKVIAEKKKTIEELLHPKIVRPNNLDQTGISSFQNVTAHGKIEGVNAETINQPILVRAQNVHDYFMEHHKEHDWENLGSFSCVRQPFKEMLITYDHLFKGPHPHSDQAALKKIGIKYPFLRRMAVFATERTPEWFAHYLKPETNKISIMGRKINDKITINPDPSPQLSEESQSTLVRVVENAKPSTFIEIRIATDAQEVPGRWFVMLDPTGQVIVYENYGYLLIHSPEELSGMDYTGMTVGDLEDFFGRHGAIALATIQFMNCKNVEVIDNPPTRQQRRQAERHNEPPPTTYKTLVIHPFGKKRQVVRHQDGTPIPGVSLHICRGHFKHFREDGPGLGKYHIKGMWWWSPQVRGRAEHGKVEKDYEVEPE